MLTKIGLWGKHLRLTICKKAANQVSFYFDCWEFNIFLHCHWHDCSDPPIIPKTRRYIRFWWFLVVFGGFWWWTKFYVKSILRITTGVKFPVTSKLRCWIGWIFRDDSNWEKFKRNILELNWILSLRIAQKREPVLKVHLVTARKGVLENSQ